MTNRTPEEIARGLTDVQRRFILKKRPTLEDQSLSKADWEAVTPCVPTGEEYPDVIWFGGMVCAWGPGANKPTYTFRFNALGLAVRAHLERCNSGFQDSASTPEGERP